MKDKHTIVISREVSRLEPFFSHLTHGSSRERSIAYRNLGLSSDFNDINCKSHGYHAKVLLD